MPRLFLTSREQDFIADITKEYTKDILGQYIIYFPVSVLHTKVHPVYDEAVEKIFENPIKVDVLAGQPERTKKWDAFGMEKGSTLELYIQSRDLIDKGFEISSGDFFLYGEEVYEILNALDVENIYGQVEYDKAKKVTAMLSRTGQFDISTFKDMLSQTKEFSESAVQKRFVQQRGIAENEEGVTNDVRSIRKRLGEDAMAPVALDEGPRKIIPDVEPEEGTDDFDEATDAKGNSFYNE